MKDEIILCIVGWYGTETLGDRAILDGIIYIYKQLYEKVVIKLGSLYPFYSQRTLYEDQNTFNTIIEVFDEKDIVELRENVKQSDCVIMGGGPIMDNIKELYIVYRAFKYGKHYKKRNILFGCGLGPLSTEKYINIAHDIIQISDLIIYRDSISLKYSDVLFGKLNNASVCADPAIISICRYKEAMSCSLTNSVSLNLRRYPKNHGNKEWLNQETLSKLVDSLSLVYETVYLVPMHSFFIGGDDREYLYEISSNGKNHKNVVLFDHGMNLNTLYGLYANSSACIGMRYHSVVMQTLLNGNNYILNYTDNRNGKIEGFLDGLENREFYNNRIFNGDAGEKINIDSLIDCLKHMKKYEYMVSCEKLIGEYRNILL